MVSFDVVYFNMFLDERGSGFLGHEVSLTLVTLDKLTGRRVRIHSSIWRNKVSGTSTQAEANTSVFLL